MLSVLDCSQATDCGDRLLSGHEWLMEENWVAIEVLGQRKMEREFMHTRACDELREHRQDGSLR